MLEVSVKQDILLKKYIKLARGMNESNKQTT